MAKALFHRGQRVFVKPVGTWSLVEEVIPHWVKDVKEPLRVTYDIGLGREFSASELVSETNMRGRGHNEGEDDLVLENWRVFRMKNRWQSGDTGSNHHPYPGTFPVVMTDDNDWGGWRVPGAEYDRDPRRIEHQARMIMNAPDMVRIMRKITNAAAEQGKDFPKDFLPMAKHAAAILRHIYELSGEATKAAE